MRCVTMTAGLLMIASAALATEAWEFEVAVPVGNGNAGVIQVLHVTRQESLGSPFPGLEIGYTCHPAFIHPMKGQVQSAMVGDMNTASEMGFKVEVEYRDAPLWRFIEGPGPNGRIDEIDEKNGHYVADSLRVTLNLSSLTTDASRVRIEKNEGPGVFDPIVDATIAAILDNAAHSMPPLTSIRLEIVGPARYKRHAKLYRITPRPVREFDNAPPAYRKHSK